MTKRVSVKPNTPKRGRSFPYRPSLRFPRYRFYTEKLPHTQPAAALSPPSVLSTCPSSPPPAPKHHAPAEVARSRLGFGATMGSGAFGFPRPSPTRQHHPPADPESLGEDRHHLAKPVRGINDPNKYVLACAVFASLTSVLIGYDVGVMSGAILFIQEDLKITEVQEEILVGCLNIVSLIGSLAGGRTSDAIGRKWTIGLSLLVFQTGMAIMALAPSFDTLMTGRIMAGIGIGFGVIIAPVYIAEIAPSASRGTLTSIPAVFLNIGVLLGYISNYVFSDLPAYISWRVMLGVGILPSVFMACALFIIPESPRWLILKNHIEEAKSVLIKISESETDVEKRLAEIKDVARGRSTEKAVWREFLKPSPALRRMLITGFGVQCFQQITGIGAIVYYSPTIIADAGITSKKFLLAATIAVGFTKTVFILASMYLIDKVGRKPLLYVSTIGMTACLFGLGLTLSLLRYELGHREISVGVVILMICGNVAFFSVGIGPVCWVLNSEIFPLRFRAQAAAVGSIGNRISSGLVTMSFLSLCHAINVGGTFFIFSVISALSVIFVHTFVPETKGKTLEQIEVIFQRGKRWQGGELELEDTKHLVDYD